MPSEDWASLLKTDKVDFIGEEIKLPEAKIWAQIAPALWPANLYEPLIWRKDQFGNCYVTQQKSFSLLCPEKVIHVPPASRCFLKCQDANAQWHVRGAKEWEVGGGYQPFNFEADLERDSFQFVLTYY